MAEKICDYGLRIRHGLIDNGMTITELSNKVREKTGMYCDQPLISRIIHGEVKATGRPTIVAAINEILNIEG